ncbi:type II secretion system protein GspM [Marinobacterium jannaschii]|uniref:type II secretion system protein GspM n=1 Tax=Marinobacterium jannaschii TaxID=64970 RepID=UPI0004805A21|nr:type II secretion system protein M [Marinobacterium jannaschii]
MKHWFLTLPRREQRLLLIAAPLVLMLLFWWLLISPQQQQQQRLTQQIDAKGRTLEWMQAAAVQVKQLRKQAPGAQRGQNLRQLATRLAKQQKITVSRVQPLSDGRISLWAENIRYEDSLRFFDRLAKQGVQVVQTQLTAQSTAGYINLYLTLKRGGAE